MTRWHDVGSAEEAVRDGRIIARIGGREIAVLHSEVDRQLYAVRNRCPHTGGPLGFGWLRVRDKGNPRSTRYELGDVQALRCPWHGWEFDLHTGQCFEDRTMRVAVYPLQVVDGRVLVEL